MSSKFIQGEELNMEVISLIRDARKIILLVSPFIKFHPRVVDALKTHATRNDLKLRILCGKNDDQISKSLSYETVRFLQGFPDVEIRHESRLHAKFYASENASILTSMNLYEYSMNHNIEAGVLFKPKLLLGNSTTDQHAYGYFEQVYTDADLIYKREPQVVTSFGGLRKKYSEPLVTHDELDKYYQKDDWPYQAAPAASNYSSSGGRNRTYSNHTRGGNGDEGYCIRTGAVITFNPRRPLSSDAYYTWLQFQNEDYPERYCHRTGRESHGRTSYRHPILD
ncbi:phospholipase D family protein [Lewinella sp. IMCC34183]|uniref:phospholipase D family protein n=1 Tax=Lewinella sp. IMCC34183 TaxID=2248762 RepID=UPI000E2617D4|nr:phospholipase D family protein [Lewinella sp. IMCC34183]